MNNSSYYPGNYTGDDGDGYDDLYDPPLAVVVFLSLCYGSISVAAVAGNGLVIWVILTSRRMRNVTNYYIANLALADIAIGMFAIPFEADLFELKMDLGAILTGENLAFFQNIEDVKALTVNARDIILRSNAFYKDIIQNQEFIQPARGNDQHEDDRDSPRSLRECVKCGLEHVVQGFCIVEEILKAGNIKAEGSKKSTEALPKKSLEEDEVPSFAKPPKPLENAGKGPPTGKEKEKEWENLLYLKMTQEELDIEYSRICHLYGRAVGRKFLLARSMAQEPDQVQPFFTPASHQGTCKKKDNSRVKSITRDCVPGNKPDHPLLCHSISPDVRDKMASVLNKTVLCEPKSLREEKLWKNALKRKSGKEFFEVQEETKNTKSDSPSFSDLTSFSRSAWCYCGLDECECVKPSCQPPAKNCPIEVDHKNNYLLTVREKIKNSRLGNREREKIRRSHQSLAASLKSGAAPLDAFSKDPELMVEKARILGQKELKNCLDSKIGTDIADLDKNVSKIAALCSDFTTPDDKNWDYWIEPVRVAENRSEVVDDETSDDSDIPSSGSNSMGSSTTDQGITHQQPTARRIPFVKEPLKLVDVLFDKIHSKFRKLAMTSLNPQMTHPFKRRFFSLEEHPLVTLKCRNVIGDEVFTTMKLFEPHVRTLKPSAFYWPQKLKRLERKQKVVSRTIRRRNRIEGIQLGKTYRRVRKPSKLPKYRGAVGFKAGDLKLLEMPTPERFTACGLVDAGSDVLLSREKIHHQYRLLKTLFFGTMKSEDRESLMDEGMKLRHQKFKNDLRNCFKSRIPTDTESEGEDEMVKASSISTRWPLKRNEKILKSAPGSFPGGTGSKSNSHTFYGQLNEPKIFSEPYTTLHSSYTLSSKGVPTFSQSDQVEVPTRSHRGSCGNTSNQADGYTFGSSLLEKVSRKASKYSSQKLSSNFLPQSNQTEAPARTISSQSYIYKGSSKAISLSHLDPLHLPAPPLSESSSSENDLDFTQHRVPPKEESHIERSARIVRRREKQDGSMANSQSLYRDKHNRRRVEDSELTDKSSDSYVPKLLKIPPKRISKNSASLIRNADQTSSYHKVIRSRASGPYQSDSSSTDSAPTNPPRQKRRERLAWDHESGPHRTIAPYLDTQTRTTNSKLGASGRQMANYESRKTNKGNIDLKSPLPKAGPSILKKTTLPKPPSDGNQSKTIVFGSVPPKPQPLSDSSYSEGLVRPARVVTERLLKATPVSPDNGLMAGSGKRSRVSGTSGPVLLDLTPSGSNKASDAFPRSSTPGRTKSREESSRQVQEATTLPMSGPPRQASLSHDAATGSVAGSSQLLGTESLSVASSKRLTKKLSRIASEAFRERSLTAKPEPQKRAGKKAAEDLSGLSNSSVRGKLRKADALGPTRRICFNLDIGQGINCVNYLKENAPGSDEIKKKELVDLLVTPVLEVKKPPKKAGAKVETESSPAVVVNLPDLESMSLTSEKSPVRVPKTRISKMEEELHMRRESFKTLDQIYKEAHGINEKNTPRSLVERDYEHEAKKRQQLRKHMISP